MYHYQIVLDSAEKRVQNLINNQYQGDIRRDQGGIMDYKSGLVSPKYSIYSLKNMIAVYFNKDSIYYEDNNLYRVIKSLIVYIEQIQRQDGTFDLLPVNYFSAPDTAFMTQRLNLTYRIIDKFDKESSYLSIKERLKKIIIKAASGIVKGGFHTPNHRWVITAALIMSYNITGIEEFKITADKYLAEGIDCNREGEFSERSTGIYNAVNDNALILIAEEYKKPELLEYVRRNLKMILTFIEPDGSLYTGNSSRQDQGVKYYPVNYYHLYLFMAYKTKDSQFAAMVNQIISYRDKYSDVQSYAESLYLFMLYPELKNYHSEGEELPEEYEKYYQDSGVVRVRHNDMSFTITENSSNFLKFCSGELQVYLKLCASFGDSIAQFNVDTYDDMWKRESKTGPIYKTDKGYELNYHGYITYYLPFNEIEQELVWGDMNYEQRDITEKIKLDISVLISRLEDGVKLELKTTGCDRVPLKVEIVVLPDSIVEGDSFFIKGAPGQSIVAKNGDILVRKGSDVITIGPAFGEHLYTGQMRGSEPESKNNFTIYFTDFTHLDRTISIKKNKF